MKQVLRDALDARGYDTLTPVQDAVLNPELLGRDLLVSAQTGSGKTVGFGLAIAPALLEDADSFGRASAPLGLVIAPTRELALQVKRELAWLFGKANAVIASCVGGMDMRDERRALERGAHIVAATPGRLRDHIMRGSIDLSDVRAVVLDEADEMLDLGFREDLEFILDAAPEDRRTLMFSATVPKSISHLAQNYQTDAQRVVVTSSTSQHADIQYKANLVAPHDTENAVINTLLFHAAPNAIVFANTRAMVNRLTTRLSNRGFQVVALSGELSQAERTHALQAMRDGRAQVCVATDVAARGIDLPNLDLVVHAELPGSHETLLHRSGRTGRAGRKGVSALIVTARSRKKAERILGMAKVTATWEDAPSADAVHARERDRMFADDAWSTAPEASEQDVVQQLESSFTPQQLAAAYLRLYRSVRSAPEELSDVNTKPKPREEFGPSVWFSITGGRDVGAEPRRLLPMLLKKSNLNKDDIGAIRIKQSESFVQVKQGRADILRQSVDASGTLEPGAVLKELDSPPLDSGGKPNRPSGPGKPHRKTPVRHPSDKPAHAAKSKPSADFKRSDGPSQKPKKPKRNAPAPTAASPADTRKKTTSKTSKPPRKDAPQARSGDAPPKRQPKGPPPPKGKASSKKNRARVAAAKSQKTANSAAGGKRKGGKPPRPSK